VALTFLDDSITYDLPLVEIKSLMRFADQASKSRLCDKARNGRYLFVNIDHCYFYDFT